MTTSGTASPTSRGTSDADAVPDVSVVIPTRNGSRTLGVQLDALARQRTQRRYEVIVADNGSTDGTRELVESYAVEHPWLRWVDASARTGSNVARNVGTDAARAEFVLLCDSDDEVTEDWLELLASGLERASAVGGRLEREKLNAEYSARYGPPGGYDGITKQLGFLPRPIGANAGYRKSAWEEVGGFNEDYVRGGTETEFYWRLQLAGHTLLDVPEAVVHYRLRPDLKTSVKQMYIWGRQSPMLYRDFRAHGMEYDVRESLRRCKSIVWLALHSYRGAFERLHLLRTVGYQLGRIVGSVKYRVVFP
ncbi:glycosyltransferase family 2 protein [Kineococcus arenarius]|uniref:glycosyltransferase n=1 Tax=Kineococcus sp. SYSU DK007 TaxID=3383128 RepID=UPI003D7C54DB